MEKVVPTLDIDPHFIPRNSLYYASRDEDISFLQEEYNTLRYYEFQLNILQSLILRNVIHLQNKQHYIQAVTQK